ncbi:MAG: AtpZ/AtpI family protein [Acidobacteriaceae bacterium]
MADKKEHEKLTGREFAQAVMQMDRMLEIVLLLPVSVFVGWLLGLGLDRWLHQHWIYLAGLVVGFAAGGMQIVRLLREMEKKLDGNPDGQSALSDERGAGDGKIDEEPK